MLQVECIQNIIYTGLSHDSMWLTRQKRKPLQLAPIHTAVWLYLWWQDMTKYDKICNHERSCMQNMLSLLTIYVTNDNHNLQIMATLYFTIVTIVTGITKWQETGSCKLCLGLGIKWWSLVLHCKQEAGSSWLKKYTSCSLWEYYYVQVISCKTQAKWKSEVVMV